MAKARRDVSRWVLREADQLYDETENGTIGNGISRRKEITHYDCAWALARLDYLFLRHIATIILRIWQDAVGYWS
jgi:hypothetical protein